MKHGTFESPGALPVPGPLGRAWRLVNSAGVFAIVAWITSNYATYSSARPPSAIGSVLILLGVAAAFMNMPAIIDIGTSRRIGRLATLVFVLSFLATFAVNAISSGTVWGSVPGMFAFYLMITVFGYLGISYAVGGLAKVPG